MPYMLEICVAGKTMEVCKYYSYRTHTKGEKRAEKKEPTKEAQIKVNLRKAEKELRRLMNENFKDGDLLLRLDFFREAFPAGSREMQKSISGAMRKMKTAAQKTGVDMKYIYVKEVGPRGGRHVHAVISKIDTDIIRKCWPYGGIHIDPLNSGGQYRKIAAYFIKYASRTEETEGKLIGKRWYASRNMKRPKIIKRVISAKKFREQIKKVEGYHLEKETVVSGISEFTGYAYFSYTLLKQEGGIAWTGYIYTHTRTSGDQGSGPDITSSCWNRKQEKGRQRSTRSKGWMNRKQRTGYSSWRWSGH